MPRFPFLFLIASLGCLSPLAAREPEPISSLRLVSYNIKHGRGMDDQVDLERTARVLRELKPDLIALQEVDKRCTRSGMVDQAAELGRLLGMQHRFGKFMDFQGGEYGLAILSRVPITESTRHQLAPGAEPRCALEVVIQPKGCKTPISFVSIHNDWTKEDFRLAQVEDLLEGLAKRPHPVVLAGDFNARPGAESLKLVEAAGFSFLNKKGAKTFPSPAPKIDIDYFAIRGFDLDPAPSCTVQDERVASDHRPIFTALPLPAE